MAIPEDKHTEVISPEGVEERLIEEQSFRITLTGGGKYRVYHIAAGGPDAAFSAEPAELRAMIEAVHEAMDAIGGNKAPMSMGVHETLDLARKDIARGMAIQGACVLAPEKVLDMMLKAIDKDKAP